MRIRWSARADAELARAVRYIASDNLPAALEIYDRVLRRTATLESHPLRGRPGRQPGTRELVIPRSPFLLTYRVGPREISVARFLHGAQRWPPR